MGRNYLVFAFLWGVFALTSSAAKLCGIGKKTVDGNCQSITTHDVLSSIHWLTSPPSTVCKKITTIQSIPICEDTISTQQCEIVSIIATDDCKLEMGSLEFEKTISQRCQVTILHLFNNYNRNCGYLNGGIAGYPNINVSSLNIWAGDEYAAVQKFFPSYKKSIDLLKVQRMSHSLYPFDGVQYTMLSDLFLYMPAVAKAIKQIVFTVSITSSTLIDNIGREFEQGWNIWATRQLLQSFGAVSLTTSEGTFAQQPHQFTHLLDRLGLSENISFYHLTMIQLTDEATIARNNQMLQEWQPKNIPKLHAEVPLYCAVPNDAEDKAMQSWIEVELTIRCHPYQLAVPCDGSRLNEPFVPCQQELMNNLAEDYAVSKKWCDFRKTEAHIPALKIVDPAASVAFQKPRYLAKEGKVRLAFLFTLYADAAFVKRLLKLLYSADHYYLLHIDPAGASPEFHQEIRAEIAAKYAVNDNMFISTDVPIVYGASTATILLTKAMAWFVEYASGWDYFVAVTGSDYPLMPLSRFEKILAFQNPPMPFVMAWTPGTSTHIFRLTKTHPFFEEDPFITASLKATSSERGNPLGSTPMEYRSNNFGPPLFCGNQKSFYYLNNRQNKSGARYDTQWLFPRDIFPRRGRAISEESPQFTTPAFDNMWRVWKKSDPATTAIYDRESVEYIVTSLEGRKYYHFFKHMLLGSEEHYYISLLYNWPRTKWFVQSLRAQMAWNTWKAGLPEGRAGGFQTHTRFLSVNEWEILQGMSLRGMGFARKFSTKKTSGLLDKLDQYIHLNASTEAGLYWPGFFEVDTWTPGKQWIVQARHNATVRAKKKRKQQMLQQQQQKDTTSIISSAGSLLSNAIFGPGTPQQSNSEADSTDNFNNEDRKRKHNGKQFARRGKNALEVLD